MVVARTESAPLRLRVDNAVRFNVRSLQRTHRPLLEAIKTDLVLANPEYLKLLKLGKKGWGVPKTVALYEFDRQTKDLVLPRGYLPRLCAHLNETALEYTAYTAWQEGSPATFESRIQLRDYQARPVKLAVAEERGVIVAPTGSGKTVLGLEIIARLGRKTLWVTHTKDLAEQTLKAAKQHLGLSGDELGMIGDGKETIGTHLTVGMVQTLIRQPVPEWFGLEDVGTIILDEAHHCPARTFREIVHTCPARHRLGLTATPKRADGMEPVLYAVIGPSLAVVTSRELISRQQIMKAEIRPVRTRVKFGFERNLKAKLREHARLVKQGEKPPPVDRNAADGYHEVLRRLVNNETRNRMITTRILEEYNAGHSCLVLSSLIAHLNTLHDELQLYVPESDMALLTSHTWRTDRTAALQAARERRVRVILATQLADEGLDVPCLDRLFLCMPKRAASKAVQQVGRILRPAPGKTDAVVYDFVDDVGVLLSQWRSRRKAYLERGFVVK